MSCQQVVATSHYRCSRCFSSNPFFTLRGSNHDDNPRRHPIKRAVERVGGLLRCRDKWVVVGERKRKTPEGLSAVDTPSPLPSSYALSLSLSLFLQRRPFNERNLLFAGARALATRRRSAYDSRPGLSFSHFLFQCLCTCIYICISFFLSARRSLSTIRFHERDARVACILRTVDFAVSRVKDNQPPLRTTPPPGSFLDCWLTACCHVATPRPKGIGRRARRAGNSNSSPFLFVSLFGANWPYIYISML